MSRRANETRYWDYTKGPLPESYWEQRRKEAEIQEYHQRSVDAAWMWGTIAFIACLVIGTIAASLLGYGPIN